MVVRIGRLIIGVEYKELKEESIFDKDQLIVKMNGRWMFTIRKDQESGEIRHIRYYILFPTVSQVSGDVDVEDCGYMPVTFNSPKYNQYVRYDDYVSRLRRAGLLK